MGFPKNSAFGDERNHFAFPVDERIARAKQETADVDRGMPPREAGRIASVRISALEQWIDDLEVITDAYSGPELRDVIDQMRSYLPG